jgi:glycosyltransferase involved in cell wall biosynthesis
LNILFYTRFFPDPQFGGIERVTSVLTTAFTKKGYTVYCAVPFFSKPKTIMETDFKDVFYLKKGIEKNKKRLYEFIMDNCIDIIISQYANDPYNRLFAKMKKGCNVKLITVYHWAPGCELLNAKLSMSQSLLNNSHAEKIKCLVKKCLRPFYLKYITCRSYPKIRFAYYNSNIYVLLSERFKDDFITTYHIKGDRSKDITPLHTQWILSKIYGIGNPLSFDYFYSISELDKKEKIVLIVARHDENQKRISLALRIWQYIQKEDDNWHLVLIGEGPDSEKYKLLTKKLHLQNVIFAGKLNPKLYYYKASIFMMTSPCEGFGVTLIEAQQMGCVPIVFDSYSSLHDIVKHDVNGVIVENNNIDDYIVKLKKLMIYGEYRKRIAVNAINDCKKFSLDFIVSKWISLFTDIV